MEETNKQYFVQTDPAFRLVLQWISNLKDKFESTGYRACQANYIASSNDDLDPQGRPIVWSSVYNFSRTAHRTMRSHMIRLLALGEVPQFRAPGGNNDMKNAVLYTPTPPHGRPANDRNHLAGNDYEAHLLMAYLDMLFPYFYMNHRLKNLAVGGQPVSIHGQLLVVEYEQSVFWHIVTSLKVTRPTQEHFTFLAVPSLSFCRFDLKKPGNKVFIDYPFLPEGADAMEREDVDVDEYLPEAMKSLGIN